MFEGFYAAFGRHAKFVYDGESTGLRRDFFALIYRIISSILIAPIFENIRGVYALNGDALPAE